jgi:hypothetical protein
MSKLKVVLMVFAWFLGFIVLPLGGITFSLCGVMHYKDWLFILGLIIIIASMYVWVYYGPNGKSTWRKYGSR